jgi:hypothetical protein
MGGQIDAVEELSNEKARTVGVRSNVDDPRHVLRLELRQRPRFTTELLQLFLIAQVRRQNADGNALIELGVPGLDQHAA